jgi:hypothetical protein
LIVMPSTSILSDTPNYFIRLPLFSRDHISFSLSVNIDRVRF